MTESLPAGVVPTDDLVDNGRKKVLVIGKTGTGKSSLCNVLCGLGPNAKVFPVSAKANSCTQRTFFCETFFNNKKDRPISLIDTIGFDDPDKDDDARIIGELVTKEYMADPFYLLTHGLVMPGISVAKGIEAAGTVVDAASNAFRKLFS